MRAFIRFFLAITTLTCLCLDWPHAALAEHWKPLTIAQEFGTFSYDADSVSVSGEGLRKLRVRQDFSWQSNVCLKNRADDHDRCTKTWMSCDDACSVEGSDHWNDIDLAECYDTCKQAETACKASANNRCKVCNGKSPTLVSEETWYAFNCPAKTYMTMVHTANYSDGGKASRQDDQSGSYQPPISNTFEAALMDAACTLAH